VSRVRDDNQLQVEGGSRSHRRPIRKATLLGLVVFVGVTAAIAWKRPLVAYLEPHYAECVGPVDRLCRYCLHRLTTGGGYEVDPDTGFDLAPPLCGWEFVVLRAVITTLCSCPAIAAGLLVFHWVYFPFFLPGNVPRCRQCGYMLKGLGRPRCPECGTAI